MNHTIILSTPQIHALHNGIKKVLHLAERSPNIAALLDINPPDVEALEDLLKRIPRHARNLPKATGLLPTDHQRSGATD